MARWFCGLAAALILGGCSPAVQSTPRPELMIIPGVPPFQMQLRDDDCSSVALASLLSHAGVSVLHADIDKAVYEPKLGGTLLPDLEKYAVAVGARPHSGRGSVSELRRLLRAGRPVLVPIDLGWSLWRRPHYVVVYGTSDAGLLMHLRNGESRTMGLTEFDRRWATMGRIFLYLEQ